jgi:hypothetical protein
LELSLEAGLLDPTETTEIPSPYFLPDLFAGASGGGNLEAIQWLLSKGWTWKEEALREAVMEGRLEVLRWAKEEGRLTKELGSKIVSEFLWSGIPEVVEFVREELGVSVTLRNSGVAAAGNGHLHLVKQLWEEDQERRTEGRQGEEGAKGQEGKGEAEAEEEGEGEGDGEGEGGEGMQIVQPILIAAARNGRINILKFFSEMGFPINSEVSLNAIAFGKHEVAKWLIEVEGEWDRSTDGGMDEEERRLLQGMTCAAAAERGDLEFLKRAREEGYHWDHRVYSQAGLKGRVEVMEWARREGCPWEEKRVLRGIFADFMDYSRDVQKKLPGVLQWVHEQGFRIQVSDIFFVAFENGMVEVLEWLVEKEGAEAILKQLGDHNSGDAAASGNLRMLTWLKNLGYALNPDQIFLEGAVQTHVKVLTWAKKNGLQPPPMILTKLVERVQGWANLNVLRWFHENGVHVCAQILKRIAQRVGMGYRKWKVLRWAAKVGVKVDAELCEMVGDPKTRALYEKCLVEGK